MQVHNETTIQSNIRIGAIKAPKSTAPIGFQNYRLPAPEFLTFSRIKYAFNAQCDLSLISLPMFGEFNTSLDVQARTTTIPLTGKTKVTSVAIRIASEIFELRDNGKSKFNGKDAMIFPILMDYNYTIAKEEVENLVANTTETNYVISLEGGDTITFVSIERTIRLIVEAENLMKEIESYGSGGMLGVPSATKLMGRNGTSATPAKMGTEWQVRATEQSDLLFRTVQEPQFPVECVPSTIQSLDV